MITVATGAGPVRYTGGQLVKRRRSTMHPRNGRAVAMSVAAAAISAGHVPEARAQWFVGGGPGRTLAATREGRPASIAGLPGCGFKGAGGAAGFGVAVPAFANAASGALGFVARPGRAGAPMGAPAGMAPGFPMFVNAADFGAVGDWTEANPGTDNTHALQAAINAASAAGADPSGLFLPPGAYRVTAPLVVPGARGFRLQGTGRWTHDSGINLGSLIVGDNVTTVLSIEGANGFALRDFAIRGISGDAANWALHGLRLRPVHGYGTGTGLVENVSIIYCVDGINCGSDGPNENAADVSFVRCDVDSCQNGFRAEQSQQLNYDFYGCSFGHLGTCIYLNSGGNVYASLLATYDVQRLVYVGESGENIGSTTIVNARLDGNAYRTVLYEMGPNAIGAQATFIDVRQITSTPAGGARIKLGPYSTFHLIGGRNLCTVNQGGGPLFNLTSAGAGHCSILVEETGLPVAFVDPPQWVGTITGPNCHYRTRNCVDESTAAFLADLDGP
jgi:Pectate lyase superfamily protein